MIASANLSHLLKRVPRHDKNSHPNMRSLHIRRILFRPSAPVKHNMKNFNWPKNLTLPHFSRIDRRSNFKSAYVNDGVSIRHRRSVSLRHRQSESLRYWRSAHIRYRRSCHQTPHGKSEKMLILSEISAFNAHQTSSNNLRFFKTRSDSGDPPSSPASLIDRTIIARVHIR